MPESKRLDVMKWYSMYFKTIHDPAEEDNIARMVLQASGFQEKEPSTPPSPIPHPVSKEECIWSKTSEKMTYFKVFSTIFGAISLGGVFLILIGFFTQTSHEPVESDYAAITIFWSLLGVPITLLYGLNYRIVLRLPKFIIQIGLFLGWLFAIFIIYIFILISIQRGSYFGWLFAIFIIFILAIFIIFILMGLNWIRIYLVKTLISNRCH